VIPASSAVTALLAAVALDLALGEPPNRWHPVAWIGRVLTWGRERLAHGSPLRLFVSGALLITAVMLVVAAGGWAVSATSLGPLGIVLEAVALKCTLSLRRLAETARTVARELRGHDLQAARAAVGVHLVSRPTATLDEAHVRSATVESVAENLTDAFVAPLCFFLIAGLPGALAYRVINTADAMFGYREEGLEYFGKFAARLDDLANLIPARIAAGALVVGAALVGGDGRRAWAVMLRDHRRTASPNAGWTMAAMAGALGVVLEKPGAYCLGEGDLPEIADIERSVRVITAATAVALATMVAARFVVAGQS